MRRQHGSDHFAAAGGRRLGVFYAEILLVPLVAASFVTYLFDPGIVALQRRDMSRGSAFLLLLNRRVDVNNGPGDFAVLAAAGIDQCRRK